MPLPSHFNGLEGMVIPVSAMRNFAQLLKEENWDEEDQNRLAGYLENFNSMERSNWADWIKDKELIAGFESIYPPLFIKAVLKIPSMIERALALQTDAEKEACERPPELPTTLRPLPGQKCDFDVEAAQRAFYKGWSEGTDHKTTSVLGDATDEDGDQHMESKREEPSGVAGDNEAEEEEPCIETEDLDINGEGHKAGREEFSDDEENSSDDAEESSDEEDHFSDSVEAQLRAVFFDKVRGEWADVHPRLS